MTGQPTGMSISPPRLSITPLRVPPLSGYPVTVLHDACATLDLAFNGVTVSATQVHAAMMAAFEFGYGTVKSTEDYLSA